jgi:hypothetical protein
MNIKSPMKTTNQKWVFVSVEVLHHTWRYYRQKQWMDKFDWTMTYRSDSEGYGPLKTGFTTSTKNIDVYYFFAFLSRISHVLMVYCNYSPPIQIIPVVRGAPNVKELLPPNTFISTQDYKSPADLAKHLKEIGPSEVTYTAILKTKQKYINTLDIYRMGMCELCKNFNNNFQIQQKLNLEKIMPGKT